jgi:hypothetical protein
VTCCFGSSNSVDPFNKHDKCCRLPRTTMPATGTKYSGTSTLATPAKAIHTPSQNQSAHLRIAPPKAKSNVKLLRADATHSATCTSILPQWAQNKTNTYKYVHTYNIQIACTNLSCDLLLLRHHHYISDIRFTCIPFLLILPCLFSFVFRLSGTT